MSEIIAPDAFASLTPAEKEAAAKQLLASAAEDRQRLSSTAIEQIKAIAESAGLVVTIENKPKSRNTMAPTHRDPANPSNVWRGAHGVKPKWLKEYLAAGRSLDEFAINQAA
jgi:DNA-binding protein H-NS